ncbi:MAG: single-stranded-DNA-specific exonuclease RecJ [Pseudomonadota bacterium]|nr:single-stranded-DNA-specific exonuclease RecJ [Pseudomonadota bacterium]
MNTTPLRVQPRLNAEIPTALDQLPPVLARIYAARGVQHPDELELSLKQLLPAQDLLGLPAALDRLELALDQQQQILIVGDFDADGATSTALMMLALRDMGAQVDFLVPDRFKYGYGLTPEIVELAIANGQPDVIVTVDNGISSHAGVERAHLANIDVIITDHHLTSKQPPNACAVVNPNQPNCGFASKALAGVGVAFYLLAALATRRKQAGKPTSRLTDYLDLVALGTVADVAPLDRNNRILVAQGVRRINLRQCRAGVLALLAVARREPEQLTAQDLGFVLGPRINAAGRMDNMRIGIQCLIAESLAEAESLAQQLEQLNQQRRRVEAEMKQSALDLLAQRSLFEVQGIEDQQATVSLLPHAIVLYEPSWHQGVIGIVAGRLKEQFHRPSIVFAPSDSSCEVLKGSARSIAGVHVRDAIEQVAEQYQGMITHFGGHAMAAGLTLPAQHLEQFQQAFNQIVSAHAPELFEPVLLVDGELSAEEFSLDFAQRLAAAGPWGQAFPTPLFQGEFQVLEHRWLQDKHLKLMLRHPKGGQWLEALMFNAHQHIWPSEIRRIWLVYQVDVNSFRGESRVQLMVQHAEVRV